MAVGEARVDQQEQFPSVDLAYEYVQPTYAFFISRKDAIEAKARAFMIFAATAMFAAPAVATAIFGQGNVGFGMSWFVAAVTCFVGAILAGLSAQLGGTVTGVDVKTLYEDGWLTLDAWTFKKDMLHYTALAYARNSKRNDRRGYLSDAAGAFLLGQCLFLITWGAELALR